jgi:hypothetical protein
MDPEELEDELKDKISLDLGTNIDVEVLPEKIADFRKVYEKPKITVCVNSISFDTPQSVNHVSQHAPVQIEIAIQATKRRGECGIFDLYKKLKKSLLGYIPVNCHRIYFKKFELSDYERNDDIWYYTLQIECKTLIVEDFTEQTSPLYDSVTTDLEL